MENGSTILYSLDNTYKLMNKILLQLLNDNKFLYTELQGKLNVATNIGKL